MLVQKEAISWKLIIHKICFQMGQIIVLSKEVQKSNWSCPNLLWPWSLLSLGLLLLGWWRTLGTRMWVSMGRMPGWCQQWPWGGHGALAGASFVCLSSASSSSPSLPLLLSLVAAPTSGYEISRCIRWRTTMSMGPPTMTGMWRWWIRWCAPMTATVLLHNTSHEVDVRLVCFCLLWSCSFTGRCSDVMCFECHFIHCLHC